MRDRSIRPTPVNTRVRVRPFAARLAGLVLLATAFLLQSCGDRNVVLRVDVLSYLDPADTQFSFGPIPAVPGGLYSGEQPVVRDLAVNLVDNFSNVAAVNTVSLGLDVRWADQTGSGTDTVRVYMSDANTDPLRTQPVLVQPVTLAPGVSDTTSAQITGDSRVLSLFAQRKMRLAITTAYRGPSSGSSLAGSAVIQRIEAVVVAGRKGT